MQCKLKQKQRNFKITVILNGRNFEVDAERDDANRGIKASFVITFRSYSVLFCSVQLRLPISYSVTICQPWLVIFGYHHKILKQMKELDEEQFFCVPEWPKNITLRKALNTTSVNFILFSIVQQVRKKYHS